MIYEVWHRESGRLLADRCRAAHGFWSRLRGWLGSRPQGGAGLWLRPCAWIHTMGMPAAIDVLFCGGGSQERSVRKAVVHLRPCRAAGAREAEEAFELPAGRAAGVAPGDHIDIVARHH